MLSLSRISKRILQSIIMLSLALLMSGCLVESGVPLSPPVPLAADDPLIGTWVHTKKEGETTYLHIGNKGEAANIIMIAFSRDALEENQTFAASTTTLEGNHYLSLLFPEEASSDKKPPHYLILKYRISADGKTLSLWMANLQFFADAVKNGEIAGAMESKSFASSVFLSADDRSLQRFIAKHDKQIFTDAEALGEFKKVR